MVKTVFLSFFLSFFLFSFFFFYDYFILLSSLRISVVSFFFLLFTAANIFSYKINNIDSNQLFDTSWFVWPKERSLLKKICNKTVASGGFSYATVVSCKDRVSLKEHSVNSPLISILGKINLHLIFHPSQM